MYKNKARLIRLGIFIYALLICVSQCQHTLAQLMLAGALLRYCHIINARARHLNDDEHYYYCCCCCCKVSCHFTFCHTLSSHLEITQRIYHKCV